MLIFTEKIKKKKQLWCENKFRLKKTHGKDVHNQRKAIWFLTRLEPPYILQQQRAFVSRQQKPLIPATSQQNCKISNTMILLQPNYICQFLYK